MILQIQDTELSRIQFIEEFLLKLNAKELNRSGNFSSCFVLPDNPNMVIKIHRSSDKGYLTFLRFALKHQDNPYLPKIYSAIHYCYFGQLDEYESYLVIRMELLEHNLDAAVKFGEALIKGYTGYSDCCQVQFINSTKVASENLKCSVPEEIKHVQVILRILKFLFRNFCRDMHSHNIMFRGATPVITDPVYQ